MDEEWWESPTCFICDYWWALLLVLVLGLAGYFTRDLWLPLLGIEPAAVPLGTGDIQVTLTWNTTNDLDLWVIDPSGEAIYYRHPTSASGGVLDVDANPACDNKTTRPVENIFWPTGGAPQGAYRVEAQYFEQCEEVAPISYHARVLVDGQVFEFDNVIQARGDRQVIYSFER